MVRESGRWRLVAAALVLLAMTGCKSTEDSETTPFAYVFLTGNTPGQIRQVAKQVFEDNDFKTRQADPGGMIFEKPGSRMNNIAYGSWIGETPVWVRVKARAVPVGDMKIRLECSAWLVTDIGSAAEEEKPIGKMHRGTYQKLLDEVAKRLRPADH